MQTNFKFTTEHINSINHLNELLKKEELRVQYFAKKTIWSLDELKRLKTIDDYNFDSVMEVYSSNEECNKRNKVEEGDPIYVEHLSIFGKETDDYFFTDDWNELPETHPLCNIPFCYSMHCIYSHSGLSWEDILQMDKVWIDIKVDFQFMISYPK